MTDISWSKLSILELILSKSLNENSSFDLSEYSKGIYLIEISNDNISETHKVVIK